MKKLFLFALLISATLFAQAQRQTNSPAERTQARVNKLAEQLQLSPDQKAQVLTLFEERQANMHPKGEFKDMSEDAKTAAKAERKSEQAAFDAKMQNILNTEQYATYKATKEEGRGNGKGKAMGGRNGKGKAMDRRKGKMSSEENIQKRVEKLTESLQLSPAQQEKVRAVYVEQQANKQAQKQERNAERKAKKTAMDAKMQAILSAEQYANYQQLEQHRPEKGGKNKSGLKRKGDKKDKK